MDSTIRLVGAGITLVGLVVALMRRMKASDELSSGMSDRRASFVIAKPADEIYQRAKTFGGDGVIQSSTDDARRELTFQVKSFTFPVRIRPEGMASVIEAGCLRADGAPAPMDALHQTFVDALRQHLQAN